MKASSAAMTDGVRGDTWVFKNREPAPAQNWIDDNCDIVVTDTFDNGDGLELRRQIRLNRQNLSFFYVRLLLTNRSGAEVAMKRLLPLSIEGSGSLSFGESEYARWSFLRQGRHKNDLPSVCILGKQDGAYQDARRGMHETSGSAVSSGGHSSSKLISDDLTVLKSNEGNGHGNIVFGFVTGASQLVSCELTSGQPGPIFEKLELICQFDGVKLGPGEDRAGEWLRVDANEDTIEAIEQFAKVKAALSNSYASAHAPSVYCTWYYYEDTVSQQDVLDNLEGLKNRKVPVDIVQIDMGWETRWGRWEPNYKFPDGMKHLSGLITSAGFRAGIWTCPFILEPRCEIRYYHPDWILRKADGTPVMFEMFDMYNYVLNVTHPGVLNWIEQLFRKLTFEWGYSYHKLDFTRAVAIAPDAVFHNRRATRAEAYRMGMEAVRKGAGPDAYILVCGGLYSSPAGLVNGHRTGSDVRSMWPGKDERGEIVAPHAIKQNVLRYWMNRLWHNDPDALMVRRRQEKERDIDLTLGLLTDDEARIVTLNQYFGGGLISFTEPVKEIENDRLNLLRHIIPSVGKSAVPRDMLSGKRYPNVYDTEVIPRAAAMPKWHTVAFVNWSDQPVTPDLLLNENLVGAYAGHFENYCVSEFWSGKIQENVKYGGRLETGEIKPHASVLFKIVPYSGGEPVLLYSNGHFSMGGTEITKWEYTGDCLTIGVDWRWDCPVEFVIAAPENKFWNVEAGDKKRLSVSLPGKYAGTLEFKLRS